MEAKRAEKEAKGILTRREMKKQKNKNQKNQKEDGSNDKQSPGKTINDQEVKDIGKDFMESMMTDKMKKKAGR
jgi:hypothetical protein